MTTPYCGLRILVDTINLQRGTVMSNSFQSEIPKVCINLKLDVFHGRGTEEDITPFETGRVGRLQQRTGDGAAL